MCFHLLNLYISRIEEVEDDFFWCIHVHNIPHAHQRMLESEKAPESVNVRVKTCTGAQCVFEGLMYSQDISPEVPSVMRLQILTDSTLPS